MKIQVQTPFFLPWTIAYGVVFVDGDYVGMGSTVAPTQGYAHLFMPF